MHLVTPCTRRSSTRVGPQRELRSLEIEVEKCLLASCFYLYQHVHRWGDKLHQGNRQSKIRFWIRTYCECDRWWLQAVFEEQSDESLTTVFSTASWVNQNGYLSCLPTSWIYSGGYIYSHLRNPMKFTGRFINQMENKPDTPSQLSYRLSGDIRLHAPQIILQSQLTCKRTSKQAFNIISRTFDTKFCFDLHLVMNDQGFLFPTESYPKPYIL